MFVFETLTTCRLSNCSVVLTVTALSTCLMKSLWKNTTLAWLVTFNILLRDICGHQAFVWKVYFIWFQREDATSQSSSSGVGQDRNSVANKMDVAKSFDNGSSINPQISSIYPQNGSFGSREHLIQESMKQKYVDSPQANGAFKRSLGEQTPVDNGGPSQFSTPSSRSLSPNR